MLAKSPESAHKKLELIALVFFELHVNSERVTYIQTDVQSGPIKSKPQAVCIYDVNNASYVRKNTGISYLDLPTNDSMLYRHLHWTKLPASSCLLTFQLVCHLLT